MMAFHVDELELADVWLRDAPESRGRFGVPVHAGHGAASTTVAYLELKPGGHIGRHVDSAEETFVVLHGETELEVGDERRRLRAGGVATAPALVPHDLRNVGFDDLRVLMVFTAAAVVTEHDDVLAPLDLRAFTIGSLSAAEPVAMPG